MSPEFLNPYRIVEFAVLSGEFGLLSDIVNFFIKIFSASGESKIRLVILFSLLLQIILIIFSPKRKRTSSFLLSFVWLAYLLADWAAGYCVGLISKSEAGKSGTDQDHLMAFWSPFLLLHLGGPYTISAFALEDNELWLRHLFTLVFQLATAVYVFLSTIPGNTLLLPTIWMFIAGTAKYTERIAALSVSSFNNFKKSEVRKPNPGTNYAKLMEDMFSRRQAGLPTTIIRTPAPRGRIEAEEVVYLPESTEKHIAYLEQVQIAHLFFLKFRGLIFDMIYTSADRLESHQYFSRRYGQEKAYRIIEIELDSMYEFFYTKASLVRLHHWQLCKYLCFVSTVVALISFATVEKNGFQVMDVRITYALLYGAVLLDFLAFASHIFTNYTATLSVKSPIDSDGASSLRKLQIIFYKIFNEKILAHFLLRQIPRWPKLEDGPYKGCHQLSTSRWSGAISGHNFIKYSLDQSVPGVGEEGGSYCMSVKAVVYKVVKKCGGGNLLVRWKYKSKNPFLKELWDCIFESLRGKSENAMADLAIMRSICSARGEWVLQNGGFNEEIREELMPLMDPEEVAFDESLLLWHIATTLCHTEDAKNEDEDRHEREISKILSDYMLYLFMMQPNLVSTEVGIGQLRFDDTCEDAKRFFISKRNILKHKDPEKMLMEACRLLRDVPTEVKPSEVQRESSTTVLFDACRLAKKLKNLNGQKWKVISSVWVELLSYAASHCRPVEHVRLLSKGGELVSFVWLLMAQLGLSTQFQILKDVEARIV